MTEKRFKAHIFDNENNERYHDGIIDYENNNGVIVNYQYISTLLNELNEENQSLKKENRLLEIEDERWVKASEQDQETIGRLMKENEQLQEQRAELFIRERDIKNDWRELKQENESLKEEIKFLQNKVATYKKGNALLKSTLDKEWK